jgi:hypothetical protein
MSLCSSQTDILRLDSSIVQCRMMRHHFLMESLIEVFLQLMS